MNAWRAAWIVLSSELKQLARDKRAVFSAVLLPAILYPLMLSAGDGIENLSERTLAEREIVAAVDLSMAPPELAARARARLAAAEPIVLRDVNASALHLARLEKAADLDEQARALLEPGEHILVHATPHSQAGRTTLHVYYDVKDDASREGLERARSTFGELSEEEAQSALKDLLGGDPALGLEPESIDISTASARAGEERGKFLPLIAVLILISGGAYAALAVFAGEREAGTLETLLVQPIPAGAVTAGKYVAVVIASVVTLGANLISLTICSALGLGSMAAAGQGNYGLTELVAGLVYLPATLLLAALLCLMCGRARTFREGQQLLLPLMLITAGPSAISMRGDLEHSALLAMVPFGGAALSLRDALRGSLTLVPTIVMAISHLAYGGIALSRLSRLLDAERILSTPDSESESDLRQLSARHGQRWAFAGVLAVYLIGGKLQAWDLEQGLVLTLLVLLPAMALACALRAPNRGGLLAELGLSAPRVLPTLGAILCIPAIAWAMGSLGEWQQKVLPIPRAMANLDGIGALFASLSPWTLVALFAAAPAVGEELFFRGAVTSSLRRNQSPLRTVLVQAAFFAAAHASIYRLAPTFLMGLILGGLRLRTGSLLACTLVHFGYNAMLTLDGAGHWNWTETAYGPHLAWAAIPGVLMIVIGARGKGVGSAPPGP